MTKRNNGKKNRGAKPGQMKTAENNLLGSAYSYYSGVVRTSGAPSTAGGVRRLFAAALLSGASMVAVGLGGTGQARADGTCLPQAGEGEQILCIGTFDETIDIDVEDVTVVLGEGSIVDTTNEEANYYGDNAGIVVNGEGDQTVVNDGTVLTGSYYDEYGEHHGIVAYADEGYDATAINSATGIVGTTSEDSYGVYAQSEWDEWYGTATAANYGNVSTTGEDSTGVSADGKYANAINKGLVFTEGSEARGVYAFAKYDAYAYNSGEIETDGSEADGLRAVTESYYSEGSADLVNAEGGLITTFGEESDGIYGRSEEVDVTNAGSVITYGDGSNGVSIEGYSVYLNNSGSIRTYGYESAAVEADSEGDDTTTIVNTGLIAVYGEYSDAIEASGPTVRITNDAVMDGEDVVAYGVIYAEEGNAIEVDETDDARVYNRAHAVISGSVEISADEYAYVRNDGSISSEESGDPVVEAFAEEGDAVIIIGEGGSVSSWDEEATAVHAGGDTAIVKNYGSVSTGYSEEGDYYGDGSAGIRARGEDEGSLALSTGSVTTRGDYAEALSASTEYGLAQAINTGDIDTFGTASVGVIAMDYNTYGYHEYSEYSGAIAGNAGDVETRGDLAGGVGAFSVENSATAYNVLGGSITTSGQGAHGLAAGTGFESVQEAAMAGEGNGYGGSAMAVNGFPFGFYGPGPLDVDEPDEGPFARITDYVDTEYFEPSDYRSTIVTTGDNAIGVAAISSGGSAWAGNFYGSISTGTFDEYDEPNSGEGSHGLVAYSDSDEAVAVNKYHGDIVTRGHGAYGIWATSDDDTAFASNKYASSIVTYGEGSTGIRVVASGEYGAYGEGYDAGAYNIASSITTHGDEAAGISIISYEGDVDVVNASASEEYDPELPGAAITTYGDDADGMEAHAEYGTVQAYSSGAIDTSGEESHGIDVSGQTVEVYNSGTIRTRGDYSHGILASSASDHTTTVRNDGLIMVTGEDANGINASGPTVEIDNYDEGEIYAALGDAIYVAYAETVTVTNDGHVGSGTADGIDIQYAESATVTNDGNIYTNESGIEISETEEVAVYNQGYIDGRVSVEGAYDAYFLNDEDGEVVVAAGGGNEDGGVYLEGFYNAEIVNNGTITVHADETYGVHLRGSTVDLTNSGAIAASGEYSHAVVARSEAIATTTIYNSGTIEATGDDADAIQASGPTVNITNAGTGVISSSDGAAIYASETKYVSIVNDGEITGDVLVSAHSEHEYGGTVEIAHTGSVDGNIDTSLGYSDDTILIDGGTLTGAVYTGYGIDEVTVTGEGVDLGQGIHATESGIAPLGIVYNSAHLTFAHDDTITLDDGIGGWAVSHFDAVDIDSGKLVLDGVGIHTSYAEGTVSVAEGATLGVTGEGADIAGHLDVTGTLDIALGGHLDASGAVSFGEGSTFRTDISSGGAGVVYGDTVSFASGSTIDVDVIGGLSGVVGDDILIASADSENGVTDSGASVEDNTILFDFLKVMNGGVIESGSADDLFLRVQLAETAEDTELDNDGGVNLVNIAKAIDEYIATQPIDSPLTQWLAQFETEEEQRQALLEVVEDTLPSESNAEGTSTMASTDLIFDMIMDRISGGGFTIANNAGDTGLSAGDAMLGGEGKWALWGRVGGLKAEYTPSGVNGFDTDMWGVTGGIDGEVAANTRIGLSAFYTSSDIEENGAGANASNTVDGYGAVAYASYRPGAWYVNGSLGYGFNSYESRRTSLGGVNTADYDGSQFVARTEIGRMFTAGRWDVTPNAGLRYNLVDVDAYTETGPLPTTVDARTVESLRAAGGVNLRYTAELEGGSRLIPELGVKVLSELADPDEAITGSVVGGGAFTTQTTPRDDVSYGVLGGLTFEGTNGITLRVTYDGEFQSDYEEQSVSAAIRIAF